MEKGIPIRSVSRAVEVLRAINRLRSPTLSEIQAETGLPYPTIFRMVQTFLFDGLIESEPGRKRYRPTRLVRTLAVGYQEEDSLARCARPIMIALTKTCGWPLALTVRVGSRMMVTESTHTLTTQTFTNYYAGHTMPVLDCASGLAYVAFCSPEEREVIRSTAREFMGDDNDTGGMIVNNEALLDRVRALGYATHSRIRHGATPGKTSSISVPIRPGDYATSCLTLIFFANAMGMSAAIERYRDPLAQAADDILKAYTQPG